MLSALRQTVSPVFSSTTATALVLASVSVAGLRGYWQRTPGPIKPVFFFRPFPLLSKQLVNSNTHPVWRLRFGLASQNDTLGLNLGLGEHVKVALPDGWDCSHTAKGSKPRSYSPTSDPEQKGWFELTVKEYEDGCCSRYLAGMEEGDVAMMSRGWPLPAEWIMKRKPGRRVGVIAFGVGITEAVWVAHAELAADTGTEVKILYANRRYGDRILLDELDRLAATYPGRFQVQDLVSREEAPAGALQGRVSPELLSGVFEWGNAGNDAEVRWLGVGTKAMKKDLAAMIEGMGLPAKQHGLLSKQLLPRL